MRSAMPFWLTCGKLDDRTYTVLGCEWMNRKNDPPLPIFIWKE